MKCNRNPICRPPLLRRHRRGGQALLELSFVVIFLVILALGIIQYGILTSTTNTLAQLARDAGRSAAYSGAGDANINAVSGTPMALWATNLQTDCSTTSISYSDLNPSITCGGAACSKTSTPPTQAPGSPFTITMTYDLAKKKMFLPTSFPGFGIFNTKQTMTCTMIFNNS